MESNLTKIILSFCFMLIFQVRYIQKAHFIITNGRVERTTGWLEGKGDSCEDNLMIPRMGLQTVVPG
jgi:hypothetical protein